jgi:glycine dehydrogenase
MLKQVGVSDMDQLMNETVPDKIRLPTNMVFTHQGHKINSSDSYRLIHEHMRKLSEMNKINVDYYGQGYYPSILPLVILRNVLENPKWYTPYTPYQAEISQGRLEMLLNYQTMIVELTGLDYANASLLDEGSAGGEALAMCQSIHNGERRKFFVSKNLFPQTIDVIKTRAKANGMELTIADVSEFPWDKSSEYCGAIVQTPDNIGNMQNYSELFKKFKENGIVSVLA